MSSQSSQRGVVFGLAGFLMYCTASAAVAVPSQVEDEQVFRDFLVFPAKGALEAFRWGISPIDDHRCPMRPSCSHFATDALTSCGPVKGALMAFDRLHRCGHDLRFYPSLSTRTGRCWYDGVGLYSAAVSETPQGSGVKEPEAVGVQRGSQIVLSTPEGGRWEAADLDTSEEAGLAAFLDAMDERRLATWTRYLALYRRLADGEAGPRLDDLVLRLAADLDEEDTSRCINWALRAERLPVGAATREHLHLIGFRALARSGRWAEADLLLGPRPQEDLAVSLHPAWYCLRARAYLQHGDWPLAAASYRSLAGLGESNRYQTLADRALAGAELPHKSPRLAGLLALFPGVGYAYTDHLQTAVAAFIVNSLTALATREAIENDDAALTVSVGLLALGWYSGSVYGSVLSARRYNAYVRDDFLAGFPGCLGPGGLASEH